MSDLDSKGFYILSLKWSSGDMLTWYRANAQGYTLFLDDAGVYTEEKARRHSYGRETIAVPVEAARSVARLAVYDSKKDGLIAAAAEAGFVLEPEPPPQKKQKPQKCPDCGRFLPPSVFRMEHVCKSGVANV
jgi:hypothetical protein